MAYLFAPVIDGWDAWGKVYCNAEAFLPLVQAIYRQEGMEPPERLGGLTPGTNAVFRCGETVVKVFAPVEAGFDSGHDWQVEADMLRFAAGRGLRTSTLLASGKVEDRHLFRYLILKYVEGRDAGIILPAYSVEKKGDFAQKMRNICAALNVAHEGLLPDIDLVARAAENERLAMLPPLLRADMQKRAALLSLPPAVVMHGDMTGENVLIGHDGEPVLIDFADSVIAPAWYEWPPIVFELFRADPIMVRAFAGAVPMEQFVLQLLDGLCLHDFGANILHDYVHREGVRCDSLDALGARLLSQWAAR